MSYAFNGCSKLKSLPDIESMYLFYLDNIEKMFEGCSSLEKIPNLSYIVNSNKPQKSGKGKCKNQ